MNNPNDAAPIALHDKTGEFFALLDMFGCSLALSSDNYRLILIGAAARKPSLKALTLPNLRGMAADGQYLVVGAASTVMVFKDAPGLASAAPYAPNTYDAIYVPRAIHFTGRCDFHDMAFAKGQIVAVNTRYSCICSISGSYSFTPLWKPPFISKLLPEDRCHLNGMALADNRIRYVSLLARSDKKDGWREKFLEEGGVLLEVPSGRVVASNLSLPHSPRLFDGKLYCLESGRGNLLIIDPATGQSMVVAQLEGFAHGLVVHRGILFIAISKLRSRRPENKLPLEKDGVELKCAIVAVEASTHRIIAALEITSGVDEIYDLQLLPNVRNADIRSPDEWKYHHAIELPNQAFWATESEVK